MNEEDVIIHFLDASAGESSPCGDEDDDSIVSPHYSDVSCPMCLRAIQNDKSVPKPTFH